jgi:hypothetical protein
MDIAYGIQTKLGKSQSFLKYTSLPRDWQAKRNEIAKRGRKAKHLAHYHGPATVQGNVEGRDRQYHITYDGKQFKRDISVLIPERKIKSLDLLRHDPTAEASLQYEPALLKPGVTLQEEELILCKTDKNDKAWYLAEL